MTTVSSPSTPDSPLTNSLRKATATIDDLTTALTNFTHTTYSEPLGISTCCCGKDDCENTKCWTTFRTKLEERLVFSAEVGQALLERHKSYVRRQESKQPSNARVPLEEIEEVDARAAELSRQNAILEKRLSQALVNNEATDVVHHRALTELKEAKDKIAQLFAQNARLVGVDIRLTRALQEKDDLQQEGNSATQRARLAESRMGSLKEKCAKLQAQVACLREDLEVQRSYRKELSEEVLIEARSQLQHLQQLDTGRSSNLDDAEVTKVLESLVADNEALKRDNAELQNLLGETREDLRVLQEEVDEQRAARPFARHRPNDSINSSIFHDGLSPVTPNFQVGTAPATSTMHTTFGRPYATPSSGRRAVSIEREMRRAVEPLTPETDRRPISPAESVLASRSKRTAGKSFGRHAPSHLSLDMEEHDEDKPDHQPHFTSDAPRPPRSLLLLTRSRAVQTDETTTSRAALEPSPVLRMYADLSQDGQSEASSLADNSTTVIGVLVERVSLLLSRLVQADALTLTTRLKRQHLHGADVSHLSRTTVSSILTESNALRAQFRTFLDDERITTTCTRRDLRALFKLFKDMFAEMGQLRVTLNDVVLDPTVAGKVSEMAMNPTKDTPSSAKDQITSAGSLAPGWMAPLTKFLGLPGGSEKDDAAARSLSPPARPTGRLLMRPPTRIVPKREPALSASATTVNVEFTGKGVGRAVTSNVPSLPHSEMSMFTSSASSSSLISPPSSSEPTRSVMEIFAGAPRLADKTDPWVVVPKPRRAGTGGGQYGTANIATVGRSAARSVSVANLRNAAFSGARREAPAKLSRIVDAVIDTPQSPAMGDAEAAEALDVVPNTLLERTLRPRGLSDSSIHTTFMSHGSSDQSSPQSGDIQPAKADRESVLQALSRRVQSFRLSSSMLAAPARPTSIAGTLLTGAHTESAQRAENAKEPGARLESPTINRSNSAGTKMFQNTNFSSWAPTTLPVDIGELGDDTDPDGTGQFYVGMARDESGISRDRMRGREI